MPHQRPHYRTSRRGRRFVAGRGDASDGHASPWFRGDFSTFSSDKMLRYMRMYPVKSSVVETRTINGQVFSRFKRKAIEPGELD